ncbi:MAG TPA: hypothetical protein VHE35_23525 [Kofleriaceae bacterium]|nr:hypothetical protein [Kofleriaceae bacterium]
MLRIGIVAEGPTDQIVLEAIMDAHFAGGDQEPFFRYIQPVRDERGKPGFGNWELVFDWLRQGRYREALQMTDIVVIHVDTDVCERKGFDVSRRQDGRDLSDVELVASVIAKLSGLIDAAFLLEHGHSLVFAIPVNEIECWLLPLLFDNKKAGKTMGCCEAASHELRKRGQRGLAGGDEKFPAAYETVAGGFRRRRDVDDARSRSPSLDAFVKDLDGKCRPPTPPMSADSPVAE